MRFDSWVSSTTPYKALTMVTGFALGMTVGTGGISGNNHIANNLDNRSSTSLVRYVHERRGHSAIQHLSTASELKWIRALIKPTIRDLAIAFNVTRQAIYDWLEGKPVGVLNAERVTDLSIALSELEHQKIEINSEAFHRVLVDGKNFYELMGRGEKPSLLTQKLVKIMDIESYQRSILASKLLHRKPPSIKS